jgi:hypothetical protein
MSIDNNELLNIFDEPDDIKQALYASWCDAEDALCRLQQIMRDYSLEGKHIGDELSEVHDKLIECRDSVKEFAHKYYRRTIEVWAQAAAEASHP